MTVMQVITTDTRLSYDCRTTVYDVGLLQGHYDRLTTVTRVSQDCIIVTHNRTDQYNCL